MSVDEYIQFMNPTLYANAAAKAFYVSSATEELNSVYYGALYNKAVALYACHLYTLDSVMQTTGGSSSGAMVEYAEGTASVKFANNASTSGRSNLYSTGYGRGLKDLNRRLGPQAMSSGGSTEGLPC